MIDTIPTHPSYFLNIIQWSRPDWIPTYHFRFEFEWGNHIFIFSLRMLSLPSANDCIKMYNWIMLPHLQTFRWFGQLSRLCPPECFLFPFWPINFQTEFLHHTNTSPTIILKASCSNTCFYFIIYSPIPPYITNVILSNFWKQCGRNHIIAPSSFFLFPVIDSPLILVGKLGVIIQSLILSYSWLSLGWSISLNFF